MKDLRAFDIEIFKLSNKKHIYDFEIENDFFSKIEDSLLEKGSLKVNATLDKSETMIIGHFDIKGTVELICDRSMEAFDFPIDISEQLIFKYGDDFQEITDEIVTIPKSTQRINLAQYLYEFIGLAIPMKKLHPRFVEEEDEDTEETDSILIYSTGGSDEGSEEEEPEEDKKSDPRWEALNNLKNNLN